MHSSLKPISHSQTNPQTIIFTKLSYLFQPHPFQEYPLLKTCIELHPTQATENISVFTQLSHQNIINLKKIGKIKKQQPLTNNLYWFYYEHVPYSLKDKPSDISLAKLKNSLELVLQYLHLNKIHIKIRKENIGLSYQNQIKFYIPAEDIIKARKEPYTLPTHQQVSDIIDWVDKTYKQKNQKEQEKTKNIDFKLDSIKRKLKTVEDKYQSQSIKHLSIVEKEKLKETEKDGGKRKRDKIQQNINCINIFHNTNQIMNPLYYKDFDNESVDTYQMELGDDYQMPSMKTNQRLRQTIFTDKKSWDTLTTKSPANKMIKNVHQSAGQRQFKRIIQENRIQQEKPKSKEHRFIKDLQGDRNWRSETYRSEQPANIQERVQQALKRAKNVMTLLKTNKKCFSLEKS